jgi:hypothetical protein
MVLFRLAVNDFSFIFKHLFVTATFKLPAKVELLLFFLTVERRS